MKPFFLLLIFLCLMPQKEPSAQTINFVDNGNLIINGNFIVGQVPPVGGNVVTGLGNLLTINGQVVQILGE